MYTLIGYTQLGNICWIYNDSQIYPLMLKCCMLRTYVYTDTAVIISFISLFWYPGPELFKEIIVNDLIRALKQDGVDGPGGGDSELGNEL